MPSERTDYELIQMSLGGCDDSFTELVNRYKNLVYSVIYRQVKCRETANDYAQDVFFKVYKNMATYSPEFKFSTWIMKITANHIIDMYRKKKFEEVSYEEYTEEALPYSNSTESAERVYLKAEQTKHLEKMIGKLPEKYRIPVVLFHSEELSYQEIANKLREPLSKVRNRIFRGRKMLGAKLAEEQSGGV